MRSRSFWAVLAPCLLLFSVACGGGESASRFCEELEATGVVGDTVPSDDHEEILAMAERLVASVPNDAPAGIHAATGAARDVAQILDRYEGSIDPFDITEEELDQLRAAERNLGELESSSSRAWLETTCPGAAERAGLGPAFGSGAGAGASLESSLGSSAGSSSGTELAAAPTPTAVPTPTPTPVPVITESTGTTGVVESYRAARIELVDAQQTNGTVETFFGRENLADDRQRLFVKMFVQTTSHGGVTRPDAHILLSPEGRTIAANALYTVQGDLQLQFEGAARDSTDYFVEFALPEPVANFDGWHLEYAGGQWIPSIFPLAGAGYPLRYPLELEVPSAPYVYDHQAKGDECSEHATVSFASAKVDLDGNGPFQRLDRATTDRRFVSFDIELLNDPGPLDEDCQRSGLITSSHDYRLVVDGRPIAGDESESSFAVGHGERFAYTLRFDIPSTARVLELVDANDVVILSWEADLAPLFGEAGWDPNASYSGASLVGGAAR